MIQNFIIYTDQNEDVKLKVFIKDETIWATQKQMAELFGVKTPAISKHLKNIFESGELDENVVISILENTTQHGAIEGKTQTKQVKYYNLDAIIAVGYRVNSKRATQFRIWATKVLREFIIKGFVLDDERLKQGKYFEKDYFDELLERIRSIRASEKEIKELERTISSFFDYIERLIEKRRTFTMEEFAKSVDKFLEFNEYEILDGFGTISHQKAIQKAHKEYEEFNKYQPIESDFDKYIKKVINETKI